MSDQIYFNPTDGGFYATSVHGDRVPRSAVEITPEQHQELLAGLNSGMAIEMSGLTPVLVERSLPIEERRSRAEATVHRLHAEFAASFTKGVPRETIAAWSTKAANARAHLDGTPNKHIAAEAAAAGVDPDELAARIAAKADAYETLIFSMDGLVSAALGQIAIAETAAAVEAAIDTFQTKLAGLAAPADTPAEGGANA